MLLTHKERPRELKWYHAGPMLYGDWGTSRFYVLGLALFYGVHASFWYVMGVCALVAAVGWAYTIVCRCFPDGGGVYSAAKHTSEMLAVVGALLLFADYVVTASISAVDGMHYLGIDDVLNFFGVANPHIVDLYIRGFAILSILFIGAINFIGPKKAGTFALIVAAATLVLTLILAACAIFQGRLSGGWHHVELPQGTISHQWRNLVYVVLALSGVEAVANMTGIMVQPVDSTAKKSIWPVMAEVVLLNLVLALAMNALPEKYFGGPGQGDSLAQRQELVTQFERAHPQWEKNPVEKAQYLALPRLTEDHLEAENRVMRVMSREFVGKGFAVLAGLVFGALLISAVNTAVGGMISIQYVMARDTELPHFFGRLNRFGVPWAGLLVGIAIPSVILVWSGDLELLAGLYAIGVVGAITINLGSCTVNMTLPIRMIERIGLGLIAVVLFAIELTLAVDKPPALIFAGSVVVVGLGARVFTKVLPRWRAQRGAAPAAAAQENIALAPVEAKRETFGTPPAELDMSRPHIMVATRGAKPLLEFAASYAKQANAVLFVIYVRQLNVAFMGDAAGPTFEEDEEAQSVFRTTAQVCAAAKVQWIPLYVVSSDVAYSLLDFAATYNVSALLMGISHRGSMLRALQGDTITAVAESLPTDIPLLIHA
jgi:amino acid transporter